MEKTTLKIEGMHCRSCEMLIQDVLEDLDGVDNVVVSHTDGTATVEYDESMTNKDVFKRLIKAEGFKAD